MRSYSFLFCLCFISFVSFSQDEADMALLARNKVTVSYEYQITGTEKNDTILKVEKHYNKLGRILLKKDFDHDTLLTEKIYRYQNFTINTSYITKHRDTLFSKTIMSYDTKDRLTKRVDYNHLGEKFGYSETNKYKTNKNGERLVTTKMYDDGDLFQHSKNLYANDCSLLSFSINRNGEWDVWNFQGSDVDDIEKEKIEDFKNYNNSGFSASVTTTPQYGDFERHGSFGSVNVKKGEYVITETYYKQNGLLHSKIKKANSIVFDHILYKYDTTNK